MVFNIQLNAYLEKKVGEDKKPSYYVSGVGSTTELDRQGEILSEKALMKMQNLSNEKRIPAFGDHDHSWKNTMGYIDSSQVIDGKWKPVIKLEDPELNEDSKMLINKMEHGTPIGLSIGGAVPDGATHYEKKDGKSVRIIDDIELYELSFVGIPANQSGSVISYIAKSLGDYMAEEAKIEAKPEVIVKQEEVKAPVVEEVKAVEAKETKVDETFVTKKDFEELKKNVIEDIAKELAKIKAESKAVIETSIDAKKIDSVESEDDILVKKLMEKM